MTGVAPGTAKAGGRIEGLGVWRALLMLVGVLLHATMGHENIPFFATLNILSGSFRMGTFFMISGLLSGFALTRRQAPSIWLRSRLMQLGVPTLLGLLILCPLIAWLHDPGQPWTATSNPYHLWFLLALLAYAVLAYLLHHADHRWH